MSLRILKVWPFWFHGLKYHDHYLFEQFIGMGHKCAFFAPNFVPAAYRGFVSPTVASYPVFYCGFIELFGKALTFDVRAIRKTMDTLKPNVVHFFGISSFTSIFVYIYLRVSRFEGKIVVSDHSDPNYIKSGFLAALYYGFFGLFLRSIISNGGVVIAPDSGTALGLERRYGQRLASLVKVIPLGFESKVFFLDEKVSHDCPKFHLGFAGKINPEKRLDILLDVCDRLIDLDFSLSIVGFSSVFSSYEKKILAKVDELSAKGIEVTTSSLIETPEGLARFFNSLDLVVFPGSISISTLEASGCGVPVLVFSSYAGLSDRVSKSKGYLFDSEDQLERYLRDLIKAGRIDIEKRRAISEAAVELSWESITNRYIEEYIS